MDGFLIINKPLGYTSRDVVNKIGKLLNTKKIGHTGTLDPAASGVLVIALGKALKLCELMVNHDKEYTSQVILGIETDTLDMDTNATILREVDTMVSHDEIASALNSFNGTYLQTVPKYSAVKVNGRKLYEYARDDINVELPKRSVNITNISLVGDVQYKDNKTYFDFIATVSKGTYIRSLVRDIGDKLGCPAVMNKLVRTRQGIFSIDNSYTLDDIAYGNYKIISILDAFPNIPKLKVDDNIAFKVRNGVILDNLFDYEMSFIIDKNDTLLALYKNDNNKCRPYKMFV